MKIEDLEFILSGFCHKGEVGGIIVNVKDEFVAFQCGTCMLQINENMDTDNILLADTSVFKSALTQIMKDSIINNSSFKHELLKNIDLARSTAIESGYKYIELDELQKRRNELVDTVAVISKYINFDVPFPHLMNFDQFINEFEKYNT